MDKELPAADLMRLIGVNKVALADLAKRCQRQGDPHQGRMSAMFRVLWLRWRIFVVNLGLRFVEWKIERQRRR